MYILKNAWTNIKRNKERNVLIGIIIMVIAAASSITLAIRESANNIVKAYQEKNQIEASISMNRENLMKDFRNNEKSQEEMINSFNSIESLTEEEIKNYGDSKYIDTYYYYYTLGVNAKDITEATDSLVRETEETETTTTTRQMPGGNGGRNPGGSEITESSRTTRKTEKIFNERAQEGAFTLVGYNSYEDMQDFITGNYTITDGEVSSDFNSNSCVINSELATINDLKVGSTITIVDVKDESKTYELTITGIYKENTESANNMTNMFTNSANKIITNTNFIKNILEQNEELKPTITPTYILKNKNDIDKFKEEVTSKGLSEYYQVTDNIEVLESATESVDNVKVFATTFLIITLIIGGVVLVVINMINIRERKYEIGVLRTIGMKKSLLSLQFMLELIIVAIAALTIGAGIGACLSVKVANNLLANEIEKTNNEMNNINKNFGGNKEMNIENRNNKDMGMRRDRNNFGIANIKQVDNINAVVDIKVLAKLLGIGILLTLFSSLASMIAISRFSPLTILKERS